MIKYFLNCILLFIFRIYKRKNTILIVSLNRIASHQPLLHSPLLHLISTNMYQISSAASQRAEPTPARSDQPYSQHSHEEPLAISRMLALDALSVHLSKMHFDFLLLAQSNSHLWHRRIETRRIHNRGKF